MARANRVRRDQGALLSGAARALGMIAAVSLAGFAAAGCGLQSQSASRGGTPPATHVPAPSRTAVRSQRPWRRPNVLVFVVDDQTRRTVTAQLMPTVYRYMVAGGEAFPHFTDSDPLCCSSRASIMTGRYNHNNHVYSNAPITASDIDLHSTIQCYLNEAGYRTGLFGKFLNGLPYTYPQPCLTDYAINPGQQHQFVPVSINGQVVKPQGWLDEFDLGLANGFIRSNRANHPRRPWYLYFADSYPHSPYVPRPGYRNAHFKPPPGSRSPAASLTAVADMPSFLRSRFGEPLGVGQTLENELRMLPTVDDHFRALIDTLKATHQLQDTLIIYMSDNGYLFGEHGLMGKSLPYTEAINVPLLIRWPGHITGGSVDQRQAQNIDLAPTIVAATRIHPNLRYPYDGRSLLSSWRRPVMLNESFHVANDPHPDHWQPSWRSIRTRAYQYIEWRNDRGQIIAREYYDLRTDPHELHNLLGDRETSNDPNVAALHALLMSKAECAGVSCH